MPAGLSAGSPFYRALLERLKQIVAKWEQPPRFTLHSMYLMATCDTATEVQAAVDGLVDEELIALLTGLPWPKGKGTYLYKQLFVLRHAPRRSVSGADPQPKRLRLCFTTMRNTCG